LEEHPVTEVRLPHLEGRSRDVENQLCSLLHQFRISGDLFQFLTAF
jgi:hypothetical protein